MPVNEVTKIKQRTKKLGESQMPPTLTHLGHQTMSHDKPARTTRVGS